MFGAKQLSLTGYGIGCCIDAQRWAEFLLLPLFNPTVDDHRCYRNEQPENPSSAQLQDGSFHRSLFELGGADRDRTGGLLVANQALSQLSYSPEPRRSSLVDGP